MRLPGMLGFVVAAGLMVAGCSVGVGYEPDSVPLEFSATFTVSPDGAIEIGGSVGVITPVGVFSVHAGATIASPAPDQTLLTIRHWRANRQVDSVYRIGTGEEVAVSLDGRSTVDVFNRKVFIGVASDTPERIELESAPVSLEISQYQVGYCLRGANLPIGVSGVWPAHATGVPCDDQHTAEVFYVGHWTNKNFPGEKVIDRQGAAKCRQVFGRYVGMSLATSEYTDTYIEPSLSNWKSGFHTLVCMAYLPVRPPRNWTPRATTGSVRNSRR